MKAYEDGTLQPHQVEWAIKKYSSHRRIREKQDNFDSDQEFLTPTFKIGMPKHDNR